ncbi:hypothetical protein P152DRAFT_174537 [Eremomyces bilateralis CBS 781.70]|uniref:Uncharacterized protein n=1 Tax=Eremomyces bilateralis CBS 781.70 TaxID=1392243 RepID=A0A6G1FTL1_9PEZI|nr:uncharacterized protein P152DRAFT_174537 [Eremomyces bilateralis CBS 781.70]KAF1809048.1 hypothetical protein P152DRAFT_174537 [Eremomyces bilateralis CBS 781.70]
MFLTPVKPRDKVVSAEDVLSALYYVHVDRPEDQDFLESARSQRLPTQDAVPLDSSYRIPRKDLPAVSEHGLPPSNSRPLPDLPDLEPWNRSSPIPEADGLGWPPKGPRNEPASSPFRIARKQPPNRNPDSPRSAYPGPRSLVADSSDHPPSLSMDISTETTSMTPTGIASHGFPPEDVLTLIRRDPASDSQWNVATISDPVPINVSSHPSKSEATFIRKSGTPLYVEVSNPGYSKFIASATTGINKSQLSVSDDRRVRCDVFWRRIWVEGSQISERPFSDGHRKSHSHDSTSRFTAALKVRSRHQSKPSFDSGGHRPSSFGPSQNRLELSATERKRSAKRCYTFLSPWGGRCEFIESLVTGSLKVCWIR